MSKANIKRIANVLILIVLLVMNAGMFVAESGGYEIQTFDEDAIAWSYTGSNKYEQVESVQDSDYIYVTGNTGGTSSDSELQKIRKSDGQIMWTITTNSYEYGGIVADADYLYISGSYEFTNPNCLFIEKRSKSTGSLITSFDNDGRVKYCPNDYDLGFQAIDVDSNYIYGGGVYGVDGIRNYAMILEKRDKSTGALIKRITNNPTVELDAIRDLVIDSNYIYLAEWQDTVWRIEKRYISNLGLVADFGTGGVITVSDATLNSITADPSYIYTYGSPRIEKRNKGDGSLVWFKTDAGSQYLPAGKAIAVSDNAVYNVADNLLQKRSISTGNVAWQDTPSQRLISVIVDKVGSDPYLYIGGMQYPNKYVEKRGKPLLANGQQCTSDSDCTSGDCNPAANGNSYCTASSYECAYTNGNGMNTGNYECYNNDVYRCNGEDTIAIYTDCGSANSIDSDGGNFPLVGGYVTDYNDACSGSSCTSTTRRDYCTGDTLTDYLANGASYSTAATDCNTYDTCVSGQTTFRDYYCYNTLNDYCSYTDRDRDTSSSYCTTSSGACDAQTWIATLGTGGNLCCGDDSTSDDWSTYSGTLSSSTSLNCRRCLNGADQGTSSLIGNGNLQGSGTTRTCYYGNIECTASSASDGDASTVYGWGYYTGNLQTSTTIDCRSGAATCTDGTAASDSITTLYGNGYVSGATCYHGDITCQSGSEANGATCTLDATDICGNGVACQDCSPYARQSTSVCYTDCANDDNKCATGYHCDGSSCLADVSNGGSCDENSDCTSNNCRKEIDSSNYYCAATNKECSENNADHQGYDTSDVGTNGNSDYLCSAQDTWHRCTSLTQCDEYANKYCDGAGTWVAGSSDGVDAQCGVCNVCGGTSSNNDGDVNCNAFVSRNMEDLGECTYTGDGCIGDACACDGAGICKLHLGQSCTNDEQCAAYTPGQEYGSCDNEYGIGKNTDQDVCFNCSICGDGMALCSDYDNTCQDGCGIESDECDDYLPYTCTPDDYYCHGLCGKYDRDDDQTYCEDSTGCTLHYWTHSGEKYPIGDYLNNITDECCGDDTGEYYAGPENGKSCNGIETGCCDNPNDFLNQYGQCVESCDEITGVFTAADCNGAGEFSLMSIANETGGIYNAHAGMQYNLTNQICVSGFNLSNACEDNFGGVLSLNNYTNAHAELYHYSTYSWDVCLHADDKYVECSYETKSSNDAQQDCVDAGYEYCMVTKSNLSSTNSHITACEYALPYSTLVCCRLTEQSTPDNDPANCTATDWGSGCGFNCYGPTNDFSFSDAYEETKYEPNCCGDDATEYYTVCEGAPNTGQTCQATYDSCCNDTNDCVDNSGMCYSEGECSLGFGYSVCNTGDWQDSDTDSASCSSCGLNWVSGGEIVAFGEYSTGTALSCCEDDDGENHRICEGAPNTGTSCGAEAACCNSQFDCINSTNHCIDNNTIAYEMNNSYCLEGLWYDPDLNESYCEAEPTFMWFTALSRCCQDDHHEFIRYSNGTANDASVGCCDDATDCVYNTICYDYGQAHPVYGDVTCGDNSSWYGGKGNWTQINYPEGVYEPEAAGLFGMHLFEFNITFENYTTYNGNIIECVIERSDNSLFSLNKTTTTIIEGVEYLNYTIKITDPIDKNKPWLVHNCSIFSQNETLKTDNQEHRDNENNKAENKRIYVHDNEWYGFDNDYDDAFNAWECWLGQKGEYLNNTVKCDYDGDVVFAMNMYKDIKVEGKCSDGIDNNADGYTDFDDISCNGITYGAFNYTARHSELAEVISYFNPINPKVPGFMPLVWLFMFTLTSMLAYSVNSTLSRKYITSITAVILFGCFIINAFTVMAAYDITPCNGNICQGTTSVGGKTLSYYYTEHVQPNGKFKILFDSGYSVGGQAFGRAITDMPTFSTYGRYNYTADPVTYPYDTDTILDSSTTYKTTAPSGNTGWDKIVMYVNLNSAAEILHHFNMSIVQYGGTGDVLNNELYVDSNAPSNDDESSTYADIGLNYPCADAVDNDLDNYFDCRDINCDGEIGNVGSSAVCEYGTEVTCNDGFDNDGDGKIDCADPDCDGKLGGPGVYCEYGQEGKAANYPTTCKDSFDNDRDGRTDCYDTTNCWGQGGINDDPVNHPCPSVELNCSDGIDNDYDNGQGVMDTDPNTGKDCRDYDCAGNPNCPAKENRLADGTINDSQCFDGIDNDLDYIIDCADIDCLGAINPDTGLTCAQQEFNLTLGYQYCNNDQDDDGDGPKDCADSDCNQKFGNCGPCPSVENITYDSCADGTDNDRDSNIDCDDSDCYGMLGSLTYAATCETSEDTDALCSDGFDNDRSGNADCKDSNCNTKLGPYGVACEYGTETTCNDAIDNDQDNYVDCIDNDCFGVGSCHALDWNPNGACINVPSYQTKNLVSEIQVKQKRYSRISTTHTIEIFNQNGLAYTSYNIYIGENGAQNYPFDLTNCVLNDTTRFEWLPENGDTGVIKSKKDTTFYGEDIKLTCTLDATPVASETYLIDLLTRIDDVSTPSTGNTFTAASLEDTAPTISEIEIGGELGNNVNVTYGSSIAFRAIPSNDASGICQCTFDLNGAQHSTSGNGNCIYTENNYITDIDSLQIKATAEDGADNIGAEGGTRTIAVNVQPIAQSISVDKTKPFYRSTESLKINSSFITATNNVFNGNCNVAIYNSSKEFNESFTVNKEGSNNIAYCNKTIDLTTLNDGMYFIKTNITDNDNDAAESNFAVFYVCNNLSSKGDGWSCAFADFDQDGAVEGIFTELYGTTLTCDNCPDTYNPDQLDTNADGIGNICSDYENPKVENLTITNNTLVQHDIVNISANVTDDRELDTVLVNIIYPGGFVNNSFVAANISDIYTYSFTDTMLTGQYNVTIIANDTFNNINNTEKINFTVSTYPGFGNTTTKIILPEDRASYYEGSNFNLSVQINSTGNVSNCTVKIYPINTTVITALKNNKTIIELNDSSTILKFTMNATKFGFSDIGAQTSCWYGGSSEDTVHNIEVNLCGNGDIDSGETCITCPKDAGCMRGYNCLVNGSCSIEENTNCNNDGICQANESCSCADCDGEQDGCYYGDVCNLTQEKCDCNYISDGICPTQDYYCRILDPDCTNLCGDGTVDAGETCQTCPDDAGCTDGLVCQENATCGLVNMAQCNNNGICEVNETCNCSDCYGKQDSCMFGLICSSTNELCSCNTEVDFICPTGDEYCQQFDPDCPQVLFSIEHNATGTLHKNDLVLITMNATVNGQTSNFNYKDISLDIPLYDDAIHGDDLSNDGKYKIEFVIVPGMFDNYSIEGYFKDIVGVVGRINGTNYLNISSPERDVKITDIVISNTTSMTTKTVYVNASVTNTGTQDENNVVVKLYVDNIEKDSQTKLLSTGEKRKVEFSYTADTTSFDNIEVRASQLPMETNTKDNMAKSKVPINHSFDSNISININTDGQFLWINDTFDVNVNITNTTTSIQNVNVSIQIQEPYHESLNNTKKVNLANSSHKFTVKAKQPGLFINYKVKVEAGKYYYEKLFNSSIQGLDQQPPVITISNGEKYVATKNYTVIGTVYESGSDVEVNNISSITETSDYNATINLKSGNNTVIALAKDEFGNTVYEYSWIFYYNGTPMVLDVKAEPNATNQTKTVNISARIIDPTGVESAIVRITYPVTEQAIEYNLENYTEENYQLLFNNTLMTGVYNALIIANNSAGLVNDSESVNFTILNTGGNSTIKILNPLNNTIINRSQTFNVVVNATALEGNLSYCNISIYYDETKFNNNNGDSKYIGNLTEDQNNITTFNITAIGGGKANITAAIFCRSGSTSQDKVQNLSLFGYPPWDSIIPPYGIYEPYAAGLAGTHLHTFFIDFKNLSLFSTETLECVFRTGNDTKTINITGITKMYEDYSLNYTITTADKINYNVDNGGYLPWALLNCSLKSNGNITYNETKNNRIYVHNNSWTLDDVTRAISCKNDNKFQFMNNTASCTYEGDQRRALRTKGGAKVEGNCKDGIDNDGDGAIDCDDDDCIGISDPHCDTDFSNRYFVGFGPTSLAIGIESITNLITGAVTYADTDNLHSGTTGTKTNTNYINTINHKPTGQFKIRLTKTSGRQSGPFTISIKNLPDVKAANYYGTIPGNKSLQITNVADGVYTVGYSCYSGDCNTGAIDVVFNITFDEAKISSSFSREIEVAIAYNGEEDSTQTKFRIYFDNAALSNDDESETASFSGQVCADSSNNDLDMGNNILGKTSLDDNKDCYDIDCNNSIGPLQNNFFTSKQAECNYQNESNCTDEYDNDWDSNIYDAFDRTDCHDISDCFRQSDKGCPEEENISKYSCADSINNDWDYVSGPYDIRPNSEAYGVYGVIDLYDCKDPDCNMSIGSLTNDSLLCEYEFELNCNDGFNNDAFQKADCDIDTMANSKTLPTFSSAEYDCQKHCRSVGVTQEKGNNCSDNIDNDYDYYEFSQRPGTTDYLYGTQNTSYGAGIDCRWVDYEPDEDCNLTELTFADGSGRCELAYELTCNDSFDNDRDRDANTMYKPGWSNNEQGHELFYGTNFTYSGDYDDYNCKYEIVVPNKESNQSGMCNATYCPAEYNWCYDSVDNDMDNYLANGLTLNNAGGAGIDCAAPTANYDVDCNNTYINVSGEGIGQCQLGKETNCMDNFDNDRDQLDATGWSYKNDGYRTFNLGADCSDYDCYNNVNADGNFGNGTHNFSCAINEYSGADYGNKGYNPQPTWCFDGIDNDLDGIFDCDDPDCYGVYNPATGKTCEQTEFDQALYTLGLSDHYCNDVFDNDERAGDNVLNTYPPLKMDCDDQDCHQQFGNCGPCPSIENTTWNSCFDGIDNDHDGNIDCADTDCNNMLKNRQGFTCTQTISENTTFYCSDSVDNDNDGNTDCRDGNCNNVIFRADGKVCNYEAVEATCNDNIDNDLDGKIDCYDEDCYAICEIAAITGTGTISHDAENLSSTMTGGLNSKLSITSYTRRLKKGNDYYITFSYNAEATNAADIFIGTAANPLPNAADIANAQIISSSPAGWSFTEKNPTSGFVLASYSGSSTSMFSITVMIPSANVVLNDTSYGILAGTQQFTGEQTLNIEVVDNNAPVMNGIFIEPSDGLLEKGDALQILVNGSDPIIENQAREGSIAYCVINITGQKAYSTTVNNCKLSYGINEAGTYNVKAYAYDIAGNKGNVIEDNITVKIIPKFNQTTKLNRTYYNGSINVLDSISAYFTADNIVNCNIEILDENDNTVYANNFGDSNNICTKAVSLPANIYNNDSMYFIRINATDSNNYSVVSDKQLFFVCNNASSKSTGWSCAFMDMDMDGYTEGISSNFFVGKTCDNCPSIYNPDQNDSNANGVGDVCDSCGDGVIDAGENCITCPDDAGCLSGQICQGNGTCGDTGPSNCNNDNICGFNESCDCADCNLKQDGCSIGLQCDPSMEKCSCNNISDGVCSAFDPVCVLIDPDCCGDGICQPGETCENCPIDCGVCPGEVSTAPSGSGAGIGGYVSGCAYMTPLVYLSQGEEFNWNINCMEMYGANVVADGDISGFRLTIVKIDMEEDQKVPIIKNAYSYFKIQTLRDYDNLRYADLYFKIEKEDIDVISSPGNVYLNKYRNKWGKLKTNLIKQDKKYYYFKARTYGLSYFAITIEPGEEKEKIVMEEEEKEEIRLIIKPPREEIPGVVVGEGYLKEIMYLIALLLLLSVSVNHQYLQQKYAETAIYIKTFKETKKRILMWFVLGYDEQEIKEGLKRKGIRIQSRTIKKQKHIYSMMHRRVKRYVMKGYHFRYVYNMLKNKYDKKLIKIMYFKALKEKPSITEIVKEKIKAFDKEIEKTGKRTKKKIKQKAEDIEYNIFAIEENIIKSITRFNKHVKENLKLLERRVKRKILTGIENAEEVAIETEQAIASSIKHLEKEITRYNRLIKHKIEHLRSKLEMLEIIEKRKVKKLAKKEERKITKEEEHLKLQLTRYEDKLKKNERHLKDILESISLPKLKSMIKSKKKVEESRPITLTKEHKKLETKLDYYDELLKENREYMKAKRLWPKLKIKLFKPKEKEEKKEKHLEETKEEIALKEQMKHIESRLEKNKEFLRVKRRWPKLKRKIFEVFKHKEKPKQKQKETKEQKELKARMHFYDNMLKENKQYLKIKNKLPEIKRNVFKKHKKTKETRYTKETKEEIALKEQMKHIESRLEKNKEFLRVKRRWPKLKRKIFEVFKHKEKPKQKQKETKEQKELKARMHFYDNMLKDNKQYLKIKNKLPEIKKQVFRKKDKIEKKTEKSYEESKGFRSMKKQLEFFESKLKKNKQFLLAKRRWPKIKRNIERKEEPEKKREYKGNKELENIENNYKNMIKKNKEYIQNIEMSRKMERKKVGLKIWPFKIKRKKQLNTKYNNILKKYSNRLKQPFVKKREKHTKDIDTSKLKEFVRKSIEYKKDVKAMENAIVKKGWPRFIVKDIIKKEIKRARRNKDMKNLKEDIENKIKGFKDMKNNYDKKLK